ncbi:MAG TPA: VCBS repeat-containing protein [Planctomycetota bacterium]|nr:VCBS repeat-containing protein [Planctomycetota bacterium]
MRRLALAAALAAACSPAQESTPPAGRVLGTLEPTTGVAFELVADTDGDGRAELVLVTRTGEVQRHGWRDAQGLVPTGTLRLRDPGHSLVACRDIDPSPGTEIVVADPGGTVWLPWPDANGTREPRSLARRARFTIRVDVPQQAPFVQDLDRDGRLDLLLPTLQGCLPFLQEAPVEGSAAFRALPLLPLPVEVTLDASNGQLDDEHEGGLVVPQIETEDLNGDARPDLVTHNGMQHAFHLQQAGGGFAPPIEVDLTQFQDSTPGAVVAPGSTLVLGDRQMLQRGDIDGDGIPDFVIAHRRKLWTFLSSTAGPQFVKARTQAVADDVSAFLLVDLDEDQKSDLLAFQVQLPGIGSILLGLVQSIDIDIKAVGYRSVQGAFENKPTWRRTVTLRIPPLLSLLSRQEELVQRFMDILGKARQGVRGAFVSATPTDLALVSEDGKTLELYAQSTAPSLGSKEGRKLLRELLFENPDTIFDLDRMFGLVSGLLDQRAAALTGESKVAAAVALRDPAVWHLDKLLAANVDGAAGDEVIAIYEADADPARRAYDVLAWPSASPR